MTRKELEEVFYITKANRKSKCLIQNVHEDNPKWSNRLKMFYANFIQRANIFYGV